KKINHHTYDRVVALQLPEFTKCVNDDNDRNNDFQQRRRFFILVFLAAVRIATKRTLVEIATTSPMYKLSNQHNNRNDKNDSPK
ncbi:hypothetical protein DRU65_01500, partial [Salmonella enterica subsp. enterica]|nr:hypothetical protein [Salmonella enterica subsp. enterica]